MTEETLKPCPFCGSKVQMFGPLPYVTVNGKVIESTYMHSFFIRCGGCRILTSPLASKDALKAAWNTRTPEVS